MKNYRIGQSICLTLVVASLCICVQANVTRADWPEFRGPDKQGVVDAKLPISWSPKENIVWRQELPGQGWSSPVVVENKIYLTSAVPTADSGYQLCLLIVDADSGKLADQVVIFEQPPDAPKIHLKNSHASPTPVFDGENLFLHFGHQGTACCKLDGTIVWRNSSLDYPPVHGNGGSPVVIGGRVIFTRDGSNIGKITALDKQTGELAWESDRNVSADRQFSFCTPLLIQVAGKEQLIVPGSNVVQSVDPQSVKEIWRVEYNGFSVVPRPVYESGYVFVATGFMQANLLAIDPTGQGNVTESHVKWSMNSGVPKTSSFVCSQGQVLMVSDNGVVSCLDVKTGAERWKKRVGGDFSSSLLLAAGNLYAFNESGVCSVLKITGAEPEALATNDLGERTLASPSVIADDLLVRTTNALYRIGQ
jgi:outer membrane protein assembly factor BamB